MVDQTAVGRRFNPVTASVEPGRLRYFLETIGESNPVYRDKEAAQAAGYGGLPIPPTYLFCLEMMDAESSTSIWRACCMANRVLPTTRRSASATW